MCLCIISFNYHRSINNRSTANFTQRWLFVFLSIFLRLISKTSLLVLYYNTSFARDTFIFLNLTGKTCASCMWPRGHNLTATDFESFSSAICNLAFHYEVHCSPYKNMYSIGARNAFICIKKKHHIKDTLTIVCQNYTWKMFE